MARSRGDRRRAERRVGRVERSPPRVRALPDVAARPDPAHRPGLRRRHHRPPRARVAAAHRARRRDRSAVSAQLAGQPADPWAGADDAGPAGDGGPGLHRVGVRTGRAARTRARLLATPKAARTLPRALLDGGGPRADRGSGWRRRSTPGRSVCATPPSSSCSTPPESGSASSPASTSTTSTRSVASSGCCGKGRKERVVPYGVPRRARARRWTAGGRPALARDGSGPALFLGARGGRIDQRAVRALVHARLADVPGAPDLGPARAAAHRRDPPARGRRRPASRAGDPRARVAGDDADLHACEHRAAALGLPSGASARLSGHVASRPVIARAARGSSRLPVPRRGVPSRQSSVRHQARAWLRRRSAA